MDFSKTMLNRETVKLLLNLAAAAQFSARRDLLLSGGIVNESEQRAAMHTALRGGFAPPPVAPPQAVRAEVRRVRAAMLEYAEQCRRGGEIDDVVNIGIGGSALGARMAAAALAPERIGPRPHFVSNMDGADLTETLAKLNAQRTLIIVSSKTFMTAETMANAARARRWLAAGAGAEKARARLVAVTAAPQKAEQFGAAAIFPYWQWVGGRYSLWGASGLPLALALGARRFNALLDGAREMDEHFAAAPPAQNLPLMLGLVGIWHRNICGYPTRAVLPYAHHLRFLPAYLQQLDMESCGKRVTQNGTAAKRATAPVVWGGAGTDAQHSFFQMLHQGTDIVPCEFIAAARTNERGGGAHRALLANCLAQSAALAFGDNDADAERRCLGGRPSVTLLYKKLTPHALGQLLALFEHRAFVEGTLWGVNPFDQWGVELGKRMAKSVQAALEGGDNKADSSTRGLIHHIRAMSGD